MSKRRMLVGLIGANIQGSMSPALFADAFAAAGIDGYYHLLDADRLADPRLTQLLGAVKTTGFAGVNVTYPFKQDIIALLDAVVPEAAQVGAVNTVSIAPDGRTNFDRRGWRNSFLEILGPDSAKAKKVVQVGAGGAGRAVAFALMDLGVADLIIHDLDPARANALKVQLSSNYGASRCRLAGSLEQDGRRRHRQRHPSRHARLSRLPGSGRRHQSQALGRRRHLHADANRLPERCGCQKRARAQRRRNVCASGSRSISMLDRCHARCGATASYIRLRRGGARCRLGRGELIKQRRIAP